MAAKKSTRSSGNKPAQLDEDKPKREPKPSPAPEPKEPVKDVRNLTHEAIALKRGKPCADAMVKI